MPPLVPAALWGVVKSNYHVWMNIIEAEGFKMIWGVPFRVGNM
jgi:hypothetical protein